MIILRSEEDDTVNLMSFDENGIGKIERTIEQFQEKVWKELDNKKVFDNVENPAFTYDILITQEECLITVLRVKAKKNDTLSKEEKKDDKRLDKELGFKVHPCKID